MRAPSDWSSHESRITHAPSESVVRSSPPITHDPPPFPSLPPRRSFLQPEDILIPWGCYIWRARPRAALLNRRHRSVIPPSLDLGVAIRKRKSARPMMIIARHIVVKLPGCGIIGIACHIGEKVAVIDFVLP